MSLLRTLFATLFLWFFTTLAFAQNVSDCMTAFPLCDQTFRHFEVTKGIGKVHDTPIIPCFTNGKSMGEAEENSTWIYFKIQTGGQLAFTITPDSIHDDLDFVLFQLPEDGNCEQKKFVRCMAAGDSQKARKNPCMGPTGLRPKERDIYQSAGCNDSNDNNWLKPLDAAAGEKYVLLISNFTAPNGFTIRFQGTAVLVPCEPEKKE